MSAVSGEKGEGEWVTVKESIPGRQSRMNCVVRSCEWLNKVRKEVTNREQTKRWTGELGEG